VPVFHDVTETEDRDAEGHKERHCVMIRLYSIALVVSGLDINTHTCGMVLTETNGITQGEKSQRHSLH
jgi:hypothetical protein